MHTYETSVVSTSHPRDVATVVQNKKMFVMLRKTGNQPVSTLEAD